MAYIVGQNIQKKSGFGTWNWNDFDFLAAVNEFPDDDSSNDFVLLDLLLNLALPLSLGLLVKVVRRPISRRLDVGLNQQVLNPKQNMLDVQGGPPVFIQQTQTDVAALINVWVEHLVVEFQ